MSWLYSRALVEAYSQENNSDGGPSAPSSGNPTPQAYLSPDRMTAFSRLSRFGMTFAPLTDALGADVLTWFLAGSRAKTFPPRDAAQASKASEAACGQKWRGSLAKYDHDSRGWKTAQCSLLADSDEFLETWPRWGTTVGGELFLLPMPALPTSESGFGLLRTPNASDNKDRGNVSNPSIQRRMRIGKQIGLSMLFAKAPCPLCVEGMMGWMRGWTDLKPLGTDKSHNQPPLPGDC